MSRLRWQELPAELQARIHAVVGSEVVAAETQAGGFSPGVASRCVLADGRRVFVKAVSAAQNEFSPGMHRREIQCTAALPEGLPCPRLLHHFDDGTWVVLVFEDIDGQTPNVPWQPEQLRLVIDALARLPEHTDPSPVAGLRTIGESLAGTFTGWAKLAAEGIGDGRHPVGNLEPWVADHLHTLADWETGWADGCGGSALIHMDLRSDNLIIDRADQVWFIDWAHAGIAAPWVDLAGMIPSIAMEGGPPPQDIWALSPFAAEADSEAVTRFVVAFAGYFTWGARQPPPHGLPTLRPFMEAQGVHARAWARARLGL